MRTGGELMRADGGLKQTDCELMHAGGEFVHTGGEFVHADGELVHADGELKHADGLLVRKRSESSAVHLAHDIERTSVSWPSVMWWKGSALEMRPPGGHGDAECSFLAAARDFTRSAHQLGEGSRPLSDRSASNIGDDETITRRQSAALSHSVSHHAVVNTRALQTSDARFSQRSTGNLVACSIVVGYLGDLATAPRHAQAARSRLELTRCRRTSAIGECGLRDILETRRR